MLHTGRDIDRRTRADAALLAGHGEGGLSAKHHIELVLAMDALPVDAADR